MGQWERRISARSGRSSDTRHDFERNTVCREVIHLFTQTTKDTGVAALKSHDETPLLRFVNKDGIDLILRGRMHAAALADRDNLSRGWNLL